MIPVLEAVPNFSEGRDDSVVAEIVDAAAGAGADVLDWSSDPDHNRSVVTLVGDPAAVEDAVVAAARVAVERIDLRRHEGVHPRIGALDVLPLVPLRNLSMEDAVASARRVGARLVELGVPVYFYGAASPASTEPPGSSGVSRPRRSLAELRRGGFEALADGFPPGREPDLSPAGADAPHPTAGVTCVGARALLLAWNVYVEGVALDELRAVARDLREQGGGIPSLRALAFELRTRGRSQISMNLEDLDAASPFDVFRAIEERVAALGGRISGTEVIGMMPDALVLPAATDRLQLLDAHPSRLLSARLADHVSSRASRAVHALLDAVAGAGDACPPAIREAAELLARRTQPIPGQQR